MACIPQTPYPAYIEPISGGYRTPSRKAKAQGGFPEPVRPRTRAGFACWRDGCRRGRGKRANADGGPMLP
ncbi:MAG: hypothetical protein E5X48_09230 [Mesorhizobium sp.]|nr:MAG: hypothetical protein E5X48_09230 [Mesorhizobium sp.]